MNAPEPVCAICNEPLCEYCQKCENDKCTVYGKGPEDFAIQAFKELKDART